METGHLDGNGQNNRISNLAWVTRKENANHKAAHGTMLRGEHVYRAKPLLTEHHVRAIRAMHVLGWAADRLADIFGVSHNTAHLIVRRETWRHVK